MCSRMYSHVCEIELSKRRFKMMLLYYLMDRTVSEVVSEAINDAHPFLGHHVCFTVGPFSTAVNAQDVYHATKVAVKKRASSKISFSAEIRVEPVNTESGLTFTISIWSLLLPIQYNPERRSKYENMFLVAVAVCVFACIVMFVK